MSMAEAALSVLLLTIVVGGFVAMRADVTEGTEAKRVAAVVVDVHEAAERYLEEQYIGIEQCLSGEAWAQEWRAQAIATPAPPAPRNVGVWVPVPLYETDAGTPPGTTDPAYLGTSGTEASHGVDPPDDCLPSFAGAGLLPPGLQNLEYSGAAGATQGHLWSGRYDLRAIARLVQLDPDPGALDPVIGVQMLIVMKTPQGEPMTLSFAKQVAEGTLLPEAGWIGSQAASGITENRTIEGIGGGWRLEACSSHAGTALAYLGIPRCGTAPLDADQIEVVRMRGVDDAAVRAFAAASGERISGRAVTATPGEEHAARVVASVHRSRNAMMREVLHRNPVAGMPELNRLGADLDFSGHGVANLGYMAGVDTDGDGYVNQGPILIGPHPAGEWVDTNGDGTIDVNDVQQGWMPTTIVGDLHVRGTLVVDPREFPTAFAPGNTEAQNLQPGSLVVASAMEDDPATTGVVEGEPEDRGTVHLYGNRIQLAAYGDQSEAWKVETWEPWEPDASSDAILGGHDHVMNAVTPERPETLFSNTAFEVRIIGDGGAQILTEKENSPIRIGSLEPGSPLHLFTTKETKTATIPPNVAALGIYAMGEESPVHVRTAEQKSPIQIYSDHDGTAGVSDGTSPIELRAGGAITGLTPAPRGDIRIATALGSSPIQVLAAQEHSPIQIHSRATGGPTTSPVEIVVGTPPATPPAGDVRILTSAAKSHILAQTRGTEAEIRAETKGARGHIRLVAEGAGSDLHLASKQSNIFVGGGRVIHLAAVQDMHLHSRARVKVNRAGAMQTDGDAATPAGAIGHIELDPDIVRFADALRQTDDTTLSEALGGATLPYTERYVTERTGTPASSADCPPGTVRETWIVPTGWKMANFAKRDVDPTFRTETFVLNLGDHGTQEIVVDHHEPYTGWDVDPDTAIGTGTYPGVSGLASGQQVDYTLVTVCEFVR